jgi:hypothetical protein
MLRQVRLPASIEELGMGTFCGSGVSSIILPQFTKLERIPEFFCGNCLNLESVIMPVKYTTTMTICSGAFYNCSSLEDYCIYRYASICNAVFLHCNKLTSIIWADKTNRVHTTNIHDDTDLLRDSMHCNYPVYANGALYDVRALEIEEFFKRV